MKTKHTSRGGAARDAGGRLRLAFLVAFAFAALFACAKPKVIQFAEPVGVSTVHQAEVRLEPLASWSPGPTKQALLDFVAATTAPGSPFRVPEEERIAVFDNDGTLWPEKPRPEAAFTAARLEAEVAEKPWLRTQEPFASILAGDVTRIAALDPRLVLSSIARTYSGMTDDAFELRVHTFLVDARHPVFGVPYPALAYRPMRELIAYLRGHKFTIYLSTTGDQGFARAYVPTTYGIPRERIIGSTFAEELVLGDGGAALVRKPELVSYNDGVTRVSNNERIMGQRPLLATGNAHAAGDIAMLAYTHGRPVGPSLALVVLHDDPVREFAYEDANGATLAAARERGFVVVSMQNDWSQVFDTKPTREPMKP